MGSVALRTSHSIVATKLENQFACGTTLSYRQQFTAAARSMTSDVATGVAGLSDDVTVANTDPSEDLFSSPFVGAEATSRVAHDWLQCVSQGSPHGCSACLVALNTSLREFVVRTFLKVWHIRESLPPSVRDKWAFTTRLRLCVCRARVDSVATQDSIASGLFLSKAEKASL